MRPWSHEERIDHFRPICVFRTTDGDLAYTQAPVDVVAPDGFSSWEIWEPLGSGLYVSPGGSVMNIAQASWPAPVSLWARFRIWLAGWIGL